MSALQQAADPTRPAGLAVVGRVHRHLGTAGVVAAATLLVVVLMAVLAPVIAPHDPDQASLLDSYLGPSPAHWLGTDATGRDIASRLIYGARTSLFGPAAIVALSLGLGVPLALLAAWRGGWGSWLITRLFDILFALPALLLAILAVAVFGTGLSAAVIALAVAYLPYVGRVAVTAAQRERSLPYVQVLAVQGHGSWRINTRHVLPNIAPLLLGQASIAFAYALIDLAALSFLGLAVQAPQADWGVLASDKDALLRGHPMGVIAAGVLVVITVMALLVLGSRLSGEEE